MPLPIPFAKDQVEALGIALHRSRFDRAYELLVRDEPQILSGPTHLPVVVDERKLRVRRPRQMIAAVRDEIDDVRRGKVVGFPLDAKRLECPLHQRAERFALCQVQLDLGALIPGLFPLLGR
jgi:hypothetical protein